MPEVLGASKSIYGFDPRNVPGCIVWSDASQLTAISGTWQNLAVGTTYSISCTGTLGTATRNGRNTVLLATSPAVQSWTMTPTVTLSAYTLFWSGRQTGGPNQRVLQASSTNNQLFGYWSGYKKSFYTDANPNRLTNAGAASDTAWDLMSHSRTAGGAYTFNWNGTSLFSDTSSTANSLTGLGINSGIYGGEASACEIGEIILYDHVLNTAEIQQIEGYLAWKWGVQANLPTSHPMYYVRPFTRYFGSLDVPVCQLWLDAADSSTLFSDSGGTTLAAVAGTIGYWRDKSTYQRNYTQATAGNRPTYSATGAVTFNDGNVLLNSDTWEGLGAGTDIFAVSTPWPNTQYNNWRTLFRSAGSGHPIIIDISSANFGRYNGGFQQFGSLTLPGNVKALIYTTTNSSFVSSAAINGTDTLSAATGTQASDTQPYYAFGAYQGGPGQPWGVINEVMIYTNLTSGQRKQVEGYLANKWGLTSLLPTTHPFCKFAPLASSTFSPPNYGRCRLWLDGADSTKVTGTSPVTGWADKSGNSVTTTFSGSPTYSALNGAITFPSAAYFYAAVDIRRQTLPSMTLFVVYSYTPNTAINSSLWGDDNGGGWNRLQLLNWNGLPTYAFSTTDGNGSVKTVSGLNTANTLIYAYVINSNVINVYVNGNSAITQFTEVTTSPTSDTNIYFAAISPANFAGGGVVFNEIVLYDIALPTANRQAVEGYLSKKWNLPSNLSATHPYYKFSPVQTSPPIAVASVSVGITSTTLSTSWPISIDAATYNVSLYSSSSSTGTYTLVSTKSVTGISTTFTLSVQNWYKVYVVVVGLGGFSATTISSAIQYLVSSGTWSFTSAYAALSTPLMAINGSLVTNGSSSFADTITGGTWYFNTTGYGGYTNPTTAAITIDSTYKAIKLPGTTYGFLSYGTWDQSTLPYPTANTSTGFSAVHTVIIIYWRYGANIGSGGEGANNAVISGSILYTFGRSSAYNYPTSGAGTYTGEIITGENGVWTYGFGPNGASGFTAEIRNVGTTYTSTPGWVCHAFAYNRTGTSSYYRVKGSSGSYIVTTPASVGAGNGYVDGSIYVGMDQRNTYYGGDYGNLLNGGIAFFGIWNSVLTSANIQSFINAAGPQFGTFV